MSFVWITPPSAFASVPIVALTAVPKAIETTIAATPPTESSGRRSRMRRRSSSVAVRTSSRLPHVCASADPSGSVA
jgi:hypothetical protein